MGNSESKRKVESTDANRDPITGEPGAHPVGAGVGAAVGGAAAGVLGAAAAGAVSGSVAAGPVGTVVGAVVGGVAGGLAGKGIAESIDPTAEDAYWRENYASRPYYDSSSTYDDYRPAYQHGWEARSRYAGRSFDEIEPDLEREWSTTRTHATKMSWDKARLASRDAWDRLNR